MVTSSPSHGCSSSPIDAYLLHILSGIVLIAFWLDVANANKLGFVLLFIGTGCGTGACWWALSRFGSGAKPRNNRVTCADENSEPDLLAMPLYGKHIERLAPPTPQRPRVPQVVPL